ncbi:MAG: prolipoprotein diacylglyceryl transferase [Ruminiclostridium sp.]|nr:prolipoprotein diacylglyceryl transferase [Ruminiclostridium sp.]
MNTVTFPGLGLSFELNRVAFCLGDFCVYWYGIIIGLGFLLGGGFCCWRAKEFGLKADDILDLLLFAGPGGIIGARIYYILFNPDLYRNADGSLNFKAMLNVHNGGLAIYGGIIMAVLIAVFVARYKKIPFLALIDSCAFGLLIGQMVGRWGNFINVEAYGRETDLPWRMGIVDPTYMEVHPTFLYESLWNLLGFCLLLFVMHKGWRKFDGMLFLLYVAWYGFGRGLIEGLRTDSLYFFSTGIRTSQMVGFVSFVVAVALILWRLRKGTDPNTLYVNQPKETTNNKQEERH